MESVPYWRLSGFYFCYFAGMGALSPYLGPYLQSSGFSAVAIGAVVAILNGVRIIAPNLWSWLGDLSGRPMRMVRVSAFLGAAAFSLLLLGSGFVWVALVVAAFGFCWNGVLPQFEANTMSHLGSRDHNYALIRLWGSLGFIASVLAVGGALDRGNTTVYPIILLAVLVVVWMASLLVPERASVHLPRESGSFVRVMRNPRVLGFLLACFLLQASHGPYYAFYSIYLGRHGYSSSEIGVLWAVGVGAEVAVFMVVHRWLQRYGARRLMTGAMGLAALRWYLIGALVAYPPVLVFAQVLHAASFGVYHAVAIRTVNRFFVGRNQMRGQAVYSSLTFGAGVGLGSFASGMIWSALGDRQIYYFAALAALLAAWVAFRTLPEGGVPTHGSAN